MATAHKLVDLALTPQDKRREQESFEASSSPWGGEYPCGASISLGDAELEKLGIDGLPEAGTRVAIAAVAYVSDVHQTDDGDGDDDHARRVCLQITNLGIEPIAKTALAEMYGSSADAKDDAA